MKNQLEVIQLSFSILTSLILYLQIHENYANFW